MADKPYIARNGDASLEHRFQEYLEAQSAYENVKLSRQLVNDPKWSDTLGELEDIETAENILKHSLAHHTGQIDEKDLKQAVAEGKISEDQAQEFSKTKTLLEFEKQSDQSKHKSSAKSGQSQ